ncbi:hypothetical protein Hanom_Chr11g01037741 [Helianthus anomalus]
MRVFFLLAAGDDNIWNMKMAVFTHKTGGNSFSVPYELSIDGDNEAWAEAFLTRMKVRWENCKHVWGTLRMEVNATYPQAIAL